MKDQRISGNVTILLVLFALFVDLIQIGLDAVVLGAILNRIIDIGVLIILWAVFRAYKVDFKKTRALIFFGLAALEFFPVVDALPLWIIDVVAVIITVRIEDRLGMSTEQILNDPRKRKILQKGIGGAVNAVANRSSTVRNALNKSGWQQNTNKVAEGAKRNQDSVPNKRNLDIQNQQYRKSDASKQSQN
jgi:hypothetical protein